MPPLNVTVFLQQSNVDLERRPAGLLVRSSSPGGYHHQAQLPGYRPQLGRSGSYTRPAQPRMGRLESVQEASTASLPKSQGEVNKFFEISFLNF